MDHSHDRRRSILDQLHPEIMPGEISSFTKLDIYMENPDFTKESAQKWLRNEV